MLVAELAPELSVTLSLSLVVVVGCLAAWREWMPVVMGGVRCARVWSVALLALCVVRLAVVLVVLACRSWSRK